MRIVQIVDTLSYGDAVGNDVLAIANAIEKMGYRREIYAAVIDRRIPRGVCKSISKIPKLNADDILLYHLSIGTDLNMKITTYPCKKVVIYHNITPGEFFHNIHPDCEKQCYGGRAQVRALAAHVDSCIADSAYNKKELVDMGYECPIDVVPILIPFEDYDVEPDSQVISRYSNDGYTNILFTGRIAPNKKHEDIISAFYYYQKYFNPKSRLFLVGDTRVMSVYSTWLRAYVKRLGLRKVYFTGHIPFRQILAYYRIADAFVCMSEHEGFCVPLLEAMKFDIPVIAYNSSAVGETLGGAGILLDQKQPLETAGVIHEVIENQELRQDMVSNGRERLQSFSEEVVEKQLIECLQRIIHGRGY